MWPKLSQDTYGGLTLASSQTSTQPLACCPLLGHGEKIEGGQEDLWVDKCHNLEHSLFLSLSSYC